MDIKQYIKNNVVFLDGAMGTMLHKFGLDPSVPTEKWNILAPEIVCDIHKSYYEAGSNVISSNTFGVNGLKYTDDEMYELIYAAYCNCIKAKEEAHSSQEKFIAFDIGPLGKLLKPYGNLSFNDAVEVFAKAVRIAKNFSFDLILIETMNDAYETKAALLAAKENSDLPVFVTNAYGEDEKLVTGASPEIMAALLEGMGADAIGVNCSFGPAQTLPIVKKLLDSTSLPVIMKPNAGLPEFREGKTVYSLSPEEFSETVKDAVEQGVRIIGGCCGTTPDFIRSITTCIVCKKPERGEVCLNTVVSSNTLLVEFKDSPILIGERINPTGKKRFKQALIDNDINYIINEGLAQQNAGAHMLDVNVGLAGIDEAQMLENVVYELQTVCNLPLQLDSADATALERAMRIYNGVPLINSVNGKVSSMESIFPLVKKYGGCVVALTLDEDGIPESVQGRIEIAERIISKAEQYGISKNRLIFDPLTMTISTNSENARVTLESINIISNKLGCKTILGVSNVSFGLPCREKLNSAFFALALSEGLSSAILNPFSQYMMDTYYSYCALKGIDKNSMAYISYCSSSALVNVQPQEKAANDEDSLADAIFKGRKAQAAEMTSKLLKTMKPMDIIQNIIIPSLDKTGESFENGKIFLPQLLISADAASAAFDAVKNAYGEKNADKCKVILATVEGDIHDIGKNIVKLLLENYGFDVIDLGKDVKAETIVDEILKNDVRLVGLSALMTTTLEAMKRTVRMIKEIKPDCFVFIGGAVVTEEFAVSVNADKYTKDAMSSVRYAEQINNLIL